MEGGRTRKRWHLCQRRGEAELARFAVAVRLTSSRGSFPDGRDKRYRCSTSTDEKVLYFSTVYCSKEEKKNFDND